jgi:tetratricopeptide (TPR) repeat protein
MYNKAQNDTIALLSYQQAILLYADNENKEINERVFWARYQIGNIYARQENNEQALKIFKELVDLKDGEGQLWKKLAAENFRSISRKLAYDEYLNE